MNWVQIAFRAFAARAEIARLSEMLGPTVKEFRKVAPDAIPLAKQLLRDIAPEVERDLTERKYDVNWLQRSLNRLGATLKVDGDYGPRTKEAVRKFQQQNGLTVDGWAGIETSAAINEKLREMGDG